jgi:hypothetical protein
MGNANSSLNTEEQIPNDLFLNIQKFTKDNVIILEEILKKITNHKSSNTLEEDIKLLKDKKEEDIVITDDILSNTCTVDNKPKRLRIARDTKQLNMILKALQLHFRDNFTYKRSKGINIIELLRVPLWVEKRIEYRDIEEFLRNIKGHMSIFRTYSRIPFMGCTDMIRVLLERYEGYEIVANYRGQYRIFKKIIIRYLKENYGDRREVGNAKRKIRNGRGIDEEYQ